MYNQSSYYPQKDGQGRPPPPQKQSSQQSQRRPVQQQASRSANYPNSSTQPNRPIPVSSAVPAPVPPPAQNYGYYNQPPMQTALAVAPQAYQPQPVPAPMFRKKTLRHIPLTPQGNLVIDVPVPDKVLQMGKYATGEEFTHVKYTAATCPPDEFSTRGYTLRPQEYGRTTELFIVVTMYNEDDFLFCKSMTALLKNIAYLCTRTRSRTWGADGWKKAVICIVSDGRSKINPRVLDVLGIMGVYQEGIMKDHVNEKPVTAHIFEYTTQVCVTTDLKVQGHEKGFVPVQILFCLKEKNAKKINSHRWFFNAFGPLIRPNVCVLIDVGTKPTTTSLYHLYKTFDNDSSVGGACGEIYAELGTGCSNLLNPLVAAQNFEYKMSNILDKPLESVMGYISVLPGAFSAYRYLALQGRPLQMYFKGESLHDGADIFASNMYLAEDRILCFEIVTKIQQAWLLKYVKSAKAETDVPDTTAEFISQRRRWLNGSFFAGVHALTHWYFIFRSGHGIFRKLLLLLEFIYNFVVLAFSFFGLSSFYLTFYFLGTSIIENLTKSQTVRGATYKDPFFGAGKIVTEVLSQVYILNLLLVLICSLGNRPQNSKFVYVFAIVTFGIIMLYMMYIAGFSIYNIIDTLNPNVRNFVKLWEGKPIFRQLVISVMGTYGVYILSSIAYLDPWHIVTSLPQYLFFLPSFMNVLPIYSFCNLHDVSWGTKGDNKAESLGGVNAVKGKDGNATVEVEVPTDRHDINANYENFVAHLRQPRPSANKKQDAKTKQEDYFRNYRTSVVLLWMFSNYLLVFVLTNDSIMDKLLPALKITVYEDGSNPYLTFILWSVFVLSTIRFLGSMTYLISRLICR